MMFNLFKKKSTQKELPSYWLRYLAQFENNQNSTISIQEAEFVVLDIESTGLDPKTDRILSIGAVKIKNNQIEVSETIEIYLNQKDYNPDTAAIHGILKNEKVNKLEEKEALKELVEYLGNSIIVGHSISFDISIINELMKREMGKKLLNKSLDTVELYKRVKGGDFEIGNSVGLDELSDEFNIPQSDRHNAAGDALITAILFIKLVSRLKKRGVGNLGDLLRSKRTLF